MAKLKNRQMHESGGEGYDLTMLLHPANRRMFATVIALLSILLVVSSGYALISGHSVYGDWLHLITFLLSVMVAFLVVMLRWSSQRFDERETHYRMVSELVSDYAYALTVGPNGAAHIEWATNAFERITGFTVEDIIARGGWMTLIHPDDQALIEQSYQKLLNNQPDVCESRIMARDGSIHWVRNHNRPVWDAAQGRVVRIYGAAQDITAHRRVANAYRTLVDHSLQGLIILQDRRIVFANRVMETIIGYGVSLTISTIC